MRHLFEFVCVCALGLMPLVGCSETSPHPCEGVVCEDDDNECTEDGRCNPEDGMCEYERVEDGTACDESNECTVGVCDSGACDSTPVPDDTACDEANECTVGVCDSGACDSTPVPDDTACGEGAGTCQAGSCLGVFACTEQGIRDAIAVVGGPHTFECGGPKTVVTADEIVIDNDVILDGEGNLTVDGNDDHRVFLVEEGVTTELTGFTVTKGRSLPESPNGGCIDNRGTMTLTNSTVTRCSAPAPDDPEGSGNGGGIHNFRSMTLTNCTVSLNTAHDWGGGIFNTGTMTVTNSTVSGNSHPAVWNHHDGVMAIINSTVSDNEDSPGSIWGHITNLGLPTVTLTNSLVDGDCYRSQDQPLEVSVTSNGYNIESPGNTCGFDQTGDLVNITEGQLDLGELAANGGPTMTHKPGAGSAAIDHIPGDACDLTEDQRGEPRPETGGTMCDVGAVEVQP